MTEDIPERQPTIREPGLHRRGSDLPIYGIIGTAVVITAPGLWLLKRRGRTLLGEPLTVKPKARRRGNVVGGVLFGIGWAITGMCPGPILVNIGEGKVYAFAALAGVLVGASLFGLAYPRVCDALGMAPLSRSESNDLSS